MINTTLLCGLMMIVIGVGGYFSSTEEKQSPTALIPAAFGAILILCAGMVIWKESLRKHVMHLAALVGVLGFIGGFAPIIRKLAKGESIDLAANSIRNGLLMSAVCLLFVGLCIQSFITARKARTSQ